MGPRSVSEAVADAGPLTHLAEIGCFPLLSIFARLHIPDAVWRETVGQERVSRKQVSALGTVERHRPHRLKLSRFIRENGLESLHAGERESLYVCRETGISIVLTDDLAVREAARNLDLTPVGSLGIVVRACRLGQLSLTEAETRIRDLYEVSSLFVTEAIVSLAIRELRRARA